MPVKIHVRNFQSIADASLEVKGLTVVTGTNNSGKSALLRATRAVFQNMPGTAFIRHGETKCSVEVDFGADGKVRWEKGTGKRDRPTYVINDGVPIHPGTAVPDEVASFGVMPIQAGGQEEWPTIAPQFTGQVFLLDRPGSAIAEAVADVERVGQLNRALRASEGDKRQAAAALKVRSADLVQHEAALKTFDGLDEAIEGLDALESSRKKLLTMSQAIDRLTDHRDRLREAQQGVARLAPVRDLVTPSAEELQRFHADLAELQLVRGRLTSAQAEARKYAGVGDVFVDVDPLPARRLLDAMVVLVSLRDRLQKAVTAVSGCEAELEQAQSDLVAASAAAEGLLVDLGECPTCGALCERRT